MKTLKTLLLVLVVLALHDVLVYQGQKRYHSAKMEQCLTENLNKFAVMKLKVDFREVIIACHQNISITEMYK